MADQSEVESALVFLISAGLYPNGTAESSVPGPDCRIYRGWPNSTALDADLAAGRINVTVFSGSESGITTTRFAEQWGGQPAAPSLTTLASGNSVTFGGTAEIGQVAGLLVDGQSYAYRTHDADTPALVAANLAAMVRDYSIVQLSGSMITIAGAAHVLARVVSDASVKREVRRQTQSFRVTCWCPTPSARDATAIAIDQTLSAVSFLQLPDGTHAWLSYSGTAVFDQSQDARLYRRDLNFLVEYATTVSAMQPAMLFGDLGLNAARFTT